MVKIEISQPGKKWKQGSKNTNRKHSNQNNIEWRPPKEGIMVSIQF